MLASTSMPDRRREADDGLERAIVRATQKGLPFVLMPYHAVADGLGVSPEEVMRRLSGMLANGVIRRIGAVPNHYRLGYTANGMSVWDIPDERMAVVGPQVGGLSFVSHCYHRPRHLPHWPYNLFAMVHGHSREEVEQQVKAIADLLGSDSRAHSVLYSTRILKKTGMRIE